MPNNEDPIDLTPKGRVYLTYLLSQEATNERRLTDAEDWDLETLDSISRLKADGRLQTWEGLTEFNDPDLRQSVRRLFEERYIDYA